MTNKFDQMAFSEEEIQKEMKGETRFEKKEVKLHDTSYASALDEYIRKNLSWWGLFLRFWKTSSLRLRIHLSRLLEER